MTNAIITKSPVTAFQRQRPANTLNKRLHFVNTFRTLPSEMSSKEVVETERRNMSCFRYVSSNTLLKILTHRLLLKKIRDIFLTVNTHFFNQLL